MTKEINKRIRKLQLEMERFWLSFFPKPNTARKMKGIKSFITTIKRGREMNIDLMIKAYKLMKEASFQNHAGHWDKTGQSGRGCPECIKANNLRTEADRLFEESKR